MRVKYVHALFMPTAAGRVSKKLLFLCGLLVFSSVANLFALKTYAADTAPPEGARLITLYERGTEKTFLTTATTIGGALKEAGIEVDARDRVEPSVSDELVADTYAVNIYRARPLLVVDEATRKVVITAAQTPAQVAEDAGLELFDEDTTTFERTQNLLTDGAAERFVVTRATPVALTLYGKSLTVRTQTATVGELLKEKGISLGENDRVSVDQSAAITEGMQLTVWREGKQTETRDETVDFETEIINDANQPLGYKAVKTVGEKGKRSVTYEITIRDGKEVARKEIASVVVTAPIKQVEVHGTKVNLPPGSHTDWMAAAGISESDYGYVNSIVTRESQWRVTISNYSGSGAYGLCQALPGSKMASAGSDWETNPITQLKWCNSYAVGRYGSWQKAYEFWEAKHWW